MPGTLLQIGALVLFLSGLIFVHELGHFLVAKALGVKVIRFSIGFGPRAFGFRKGETEYWLSIFPLGGYVKMAGDLGEEPQSVAPEDRGRGYLEQPPWRRLAISFAGPLMNLVFPAFVYLALAIAENGTPVPGPFVGTVAPGSPAALAGLRAGDRILSVAAPGAPARTLHRFGELREVVAPHPEEPLVFRVQRDGVELPPLTIVPSLSLERAVAAAACAPLDLEVVRERPVALPGATLSLPAVERLAAVPTCDAERRPAFRPADPGLATFIAAVEPGSPAERAGLRRGDAIASVNGKPVLSFRDINALSAEFLPAPSAPGPAARVAPGVPEPRVEVRLGLADGREVVLAAARETFLDELTREEQQRWVLGFHPDRGRLVDSAALVVEQVPIARSAPEMVVYAWDQLSTFVRITVK